MQFETRFKQVTVIVVVIVQCIVGNSDINQNECVKMHVKRLKGLG